MNIHPKDQISELKGERTIRKRPQDSPTNSNLTNLAKVNRTKVTPKRKYAHLPKKGKGSSKKHREKRLPHLKKKVLMTPSSHEEAQDLTTEEIREDADYEAQEPANIQEITQIKKQRRSS